MPIHPVTKADPHPDQRGTYNSEEIYQRLAFWQRILGLENYLIHIWLIPAFNNEGYTQRYLGDMEAIIRLREDARIGDLERTLVHELLHLVTAPWKDAYVRVCKQLPKGVYDLAFESINDEEEVVIERLAEYLIRLAGGDAFGGHLFTQFIPKNEDETIEKLSKPTPKPQKETK